MKIIQQRKLVEGVSYSLAYTWDVNQPYSGFSFDCDEKGNVDLDNMNDCAKDNLEKCKNNSFSKPIFFDGIHQRHWRYYEDRIGECECGSHVYLDRFTNTCECGRDYNSAGQELAPREQWGDDTGEHLSDILRIK